MAGIEGVLVSAITPRNERGEVDLGAAFDLIDFLAGAGVRGIVLFGVAGEYPAATFEERNRLIYLAAKRSRVPIYAGVGSATLNEIGRAYV
jgi:dihydrodipicolinate synthase/N-acetylneuraminate lyase